MQKNRKSLITKLIFLYLITTSIVITLTISKYQSTVAINSSAKVASFVVDVYLIDGQSNNLLIDCNDNTSGTTNYKFAVTNEKNGKICEVAMKYDIIITLSDSLPKGMELTLNGEKGKISSDGLKYTFLDMGEFEAGIQGILSEHTFNLNFTANATDLQKDFFIKKINISVRAEQID